MNTFQHTQDVLDRLLPIPVNLPTIYLLGDTSAGKTTIVRQVLGTGPWRFPSVRRTRTTVAVTEYVLSPDPTYRAAMVFKPRDEIARAVREILEDTLVQGYRALSAGTLHVDQLVTALEESPDQRFRLHFLITEAQRTLLAKAVVEHLLPTLAQWIASNFPHDTDELGVVISLAMEDALQADLQTLEDNLMKVIAERVAVVCADPVPGLRELYVIEDADRETFVQRLKPLLNAEEGSLSPLVERARIRGNLRAPWLPDTEIVVIDGEGIGHDLRESGQPTLSARHLDDFYHADAILLVEESTKPFSGGGKSALAALARNGYLAKAVLAFSKLDQLDGERCEQIADVQRSLRNLLHALAADHDLWINQDALDIRYLADMHREEPDEPSKAALRGLLQTITTEAAREKPGFVRPTYDFELLAPCLDHATAAFRARWDAYLAEDSAARQPWQTVKAFTYRLAWGQEEYRAMRPVATLHEALMTTLAPFLTHPTGWDQEATGTLHQASLDRVTQEVSHTLLHLIRERLIDHHQHEWHTAAALRGLGSTRLRASHIQHVLHAAVPFMTEAGARSLKDAVKACVHTALHHCAG